MIRAFVALALLALVACRSVTPLPAPQPTAPAHALVGLTAFIDGSPDISEVHVENIAANRWPHDFQEAVERRMVQAGFAIVHDEKKPHDLRIRLGGHVHGDPNNHVTFEFATLSIEREGVVVEQLRVGAADVEGGWALERDAPDRMAVLLVNALGQSPRVIAIAEQRTSGSATALGAPASPAPVPVAFVAPASAASFTTGAPQPTTYAVIIGIEKYRDIAPPTGARADAERFALLARQTLGIREDHMHIALDDRASKVDIEKHLDWAKANVPAGGRLIFYFSGHGAPDASNGTSYLVPYDGDPKYIDRTGVPLASVMKLLGDTKAKDVLAVVDSCFSGAGGRSVLPPGSRPLVPVKQMPAAARVALFTASSGAEISGPSVGGGAGLFTRLVGEGLGQGKADIDGDGQISLQELAEWVKPRVQREARQDHREQTPSLVVGTGMTEANFIVAYGIGGAGK